MRLPSFVPLPNRFLMSLISARDPVPLLVVRAQQFDQRLALLREFPVLGLDLDLFELAQRPEPHIEDRLGLHIGQVEPRHHHGLRLILVADDADHLVEIEIGDQEAVEHFEPVLDLLQPVLGAAAQHHLAMIEPLLQHLDKAQHLRDLPLRQHRHVERHARLKLRQPEKLLHEQRRIHIARFRLDDDTDVLRELVVDIAEQRQLLGLQQVGHLLDEPRLLHAVGDFGDDDLIGAAPRVLDMPARAQAERAAPGLVGFDEPGLIVHENAARRKIRPRQIAQQRLDARASDA